MIKNILSVLSLSFVFTILFWYAGLHWQKQSSFISPLPDFLRFDKNKQATLLDFWLPIFEESYGSASEHTASADGFSLSRLTSKSILVYDLSTGSVIFEKNSKTRMPMASLTKIMTAIIAMENPKTGGLYQVKNENLVGEDSMGLNAGEVLSLEELLYGLLLPSGNDASEVLASNYEPGRDEFIRAMNDKARALGLVDTRFSNPSGLQGDGTQYTTAYDLLVMTRYAMENYPQFNQIVSTPYLNIPESTHHKEYNLYNETNLLTTYPGVAGVKTGYTPEAGMCLISYLNYKDHKIISIILNSENRRTEMKEILDNALKSLNITPPDYSG